MQGGEGVQGDVAGGHINFCDDEKDGNTKSKRHAKMLFAHSHNTSISTHDETGVIREVSS